MKNTICIGYLCFEDRIEYVLVVFVKLACVFSLSVLYCNLQSKDYGLCSLYLLLFSYKRPIRG